MGVVEEDGCVRRNLMRGTIGALLFTAAWLGGAVRACGQETKWVDTHQVGPFIFQATFPLAELNPLFAELPGLQRELCRTLGLPPARQTITVSLFANADEHREFVARRFPNVPYRRALFVKDGGQAGVYAYRHAELDIDVRHECTHALLHSVLPHVPLWLDEGLAEYFEVAPAQRAFDHPHFSALRWNMRLGMIRSIETLEQRQELADMNGVDYRYSWAWVHFMLHGPEPAHQALVHYLHSIRQGAAPPPFSAWFADAVPQSTEKLIHHFKHWHQ